MKPIFAIAIGAVFAAAGCAKAPEAVEATKIDHRGFMSLPCSSLRVKEVEGQQAVASLSARQKKAADNDALGVFLIGLPLASMGGDDQEAKLSIAKGTLEAIQLAKVQKRCS